MKATLVLVSEQPHHMPDESRYSERLFTPWWWYVAAIAIAVLLGAEFALAFTGAWAWIPTGVLVLICVAAVWRMSSGRVTVTSQQLLAGDRTLPLDRIDIAIKLSAAELRRLVGRHGDPAAFGFIRSWIGPGVQVVLRDQSDTTPYWVFSTRHPDRLLAVLAEQSVPTR